MKQIVIIANIWNPSREGGQPAHPGAVWIDNGRVADITAIEMAPKQGARPDVDVLSYPRGYVMPAFVDAHFHLLSLAHKALRCDLARTQSAGEVGERLADYARNYGGTALVGVDFD